MLYVCDSVCDMIYINYILSSYIPYRKQMARGFEIKLNEHGSEMYEGQMLSEQNVRSEQMLDLQKVKDALLI